MKVLVAGFLGGGELGATVRCRLEEFLPKAPRGRQDDQRKHG